MKKTKIRIFGNRILVRPLKVPNKQEQKKTSIIAPDTGMKRDQPNRHMYDDHRFQGLILRVSPFYRLKNIFIPKKYKLTVGDVVYYIGGDGFPVVQDDNDHLVLETKRIIGVNENGRQGYAFLNFKE